MSQNCLPPQLGRRPGVKGLHDPACQHRALQLLPTVEGFSRSTLSRHKNIRILWASAQTAEEPERFLAATLAAIYNPRSAVTMALSARPAIPALRDNTAWDSALRWLRKWAPSQLKSQPLKQAPVLSAPQLRTILRSTAPEADVCLLLLLSASRHADLQHAFLTHVWRLPEAHRATFAIRIRFPQFKSDLFGQREVSKVLQLEAQLARRVLRALRQPQTYIQMYRFISQLGAGATVHSLRRTATTILANHQMPGSEIVALTAHAALIEPTTVRRYIEPTPTATEALIQRRASALIANHLRGL